MKWLVCFFAFFLLFDALKAQTINKAILAKYSQRCEQEKLLDRQIVLLHLAPQQAAEFKTVSFYYIDKALTVVNANINSNMYSLYRKLKPMKDEYEARMRQLLTDAQMDTWQTARKKNGIVAQIIK